MYWVCDFILSVLLQASRISCSQLIVDKNYEKVWTKYCNNLTASVLFKLLFAGMKVEQNHKYICLLGPWSSFELFDWGTINSYCEIRTKILILRVQFFFSVKVHKHWCILGALLSESKWFYRLWLYFVQSSFKIQMYLGKYEMSNLNCTRTNMQCHSFSRQ